MNEYTSAGNMVYSFNFSFNFWRLRRQGSNNVSSFIHSLC